MTTAAAAVLRAPEVRTYPTRSLQVVDIETDSALRELRGRAVPYGEPSNVGWYIESFAPGAFAKSIRESARDLPLLLWHDSHAFPIGAASRWTETDDGLDGTWRLDDSDMAQTAARQARDGFLTGLSVGFQPTPNGSRWTLVDDDDWNPDEGVVDEVERTEARLLEVSLTPTPAYAGAGVTLVRSHDAPQQVRDRYRRNAVRRGELAQWRETLDALRLDR